MDRTDAFDFYQATSSIDGWLTPAEGMLLYRLAGDVPPARAIVEIGSWTGKSTACLGLASLAASGAKVYAVDPHWGMRSSASELDRRDTFREFLDNVRAAGIESVVVPVRKPSADAVPDVSEPAGLIFVDGGHRVGCVRTDFQTWFPRLAEGGRMAFHDSWRRSGPHLVTALALLFSSSVRRPRLVDTITVFEKVRANSPAERLVNILFVVYRLVAGIGGHLRLVRRGRRRSAAPAAP